MIPIKWTTSASIALPNSVFGFPAMEILVSHRAEGTAERKRAKFNRRPHNGPHRRNLFPTTALEAIAFFHHCLEKPQLVHTQQDRCV